MSWPVRPGGGRGGALVTGWQLGATPAGAVDGPDALARATVDWVDADAPTTVAAALRAAGRWSLDGPPRRFDAEDWWWRARVPAGDGPGVLCLDGLATVADVWLDGAHALASESMFARHELPVPAAGAELVIRFRALDALLAARRPRPRWRAPMVEHQQLRWFRTTLLGRTPGWSPPAAAVGPWRPVRVVRGRGATLTGLDVRPDGAVTVTVDAAATVRISDDRGLALEGAAAPGAPLALHVPDARRWWPHTHGEPALYRLEVVADGEVAWAGAIGFREVAVDRADGGFALRVNGVGVFCRGACWTPLDPVALAAPRAAYATALAQVRDAGMNMIRIGGTMVYEADDLLDLADELGVLVWQDLMFANLDYPDDDAFAARAADEARAELARWRGRPSLAVVCGNSEVAQQAAMWGAARELWEPRLFCDTLAGVVRQECPDVPYWPSSAHGGAFPHVADAGTTSYYGVGAYQRPLDDARRADVRFATECLAFANVPSPRALERLGAAPRVHAPAWKARTPRDLGAGWDFDDVRDHYVARLFRVDPAALRYADHDRYLALGRVATGEAMAATFGEWRRARSRCGGGLVWFLRDLWDGAGWGLVDAAGAPKAAYHYCRRALAPIAVHVSDEGGNGLALHVVNDRGAPLAATLELALWRDGEVPVGRGSRAIEVAGHAAIEVPAAALLDGFVDLSYAYRFGPPPCDLVVATLRAADGAVLAEAFHFPLGLPAGREPDLGLTAALEPAADGDVVLRLRTRRFAAAIAIDVEGHAPDDDHLHLAPGAERAIRLRRTSAGRPARGTVGALNALSALPVKLS